MAKMPPLVSLMFCCMCSMVQVSWAAKNDLTCEGFLGSIQTSNFNRSRVNTLLQGIRREAFSPLGKSYGLPLRTTRAKSVSLRSLQKPFIPNNWLLPKSISKAKAFPVQEFVVSSDGHWAVFFPRFIVEPPVGLKDPLVAELKSPGEFRFVGPLGNLKSLQDFYFPQFLQNTSILRVLFFDNPMQMPRKDVRFFNLKLNRELISLAHAMGSDLEEVIPISDSIYYVRRAGAPTQDLIVEYDPQAVMVRQIFSGFNVRLGGRSLPSLFLSEKETLHIEKLASAIYVSSHNFDIGILPNGQLSFQQFGVVQENTARVVNKLEIEVSREFSQDSDGNVITIFQKFSPHGIHQSTWIVNGVVGPDLYFVDGGLVAQIDHHPEHGFVLLKDSGETLMLTERDLHLAKFAVVGNVIVGLADSNKKDDIDLYMIPVPGR